MYQNIIRILKKESNLFGSGIVIRENKVLTAAHVVSDEDNITIVWEKEFSGNIEYIDDVIAILSVDDTEFREKYNTLSNKLLLTANEVLNDDSKWQVEGFTTSELIEHQMEGIGIYCVDELPSDYSLANINVGVLNNYKGLSGSPVILNGRAIGILQVQNWDARGKLGVSFSSVAMFENKLPDNSVVEPLFISELKQKCWEICNSLIDKNKDSAKYIPDIFIEEGHYKENLRYFSLPLLFVNKIIEDLNSLDFKNLNVILEKEKIQKIEFGGYPRNVSADTYDSVINHLTRELKRCVSVLEQIDDKRRGGDSIEERYTQGFYLNNSLKWNLQDVLTQLEFLSYRILLLTRNAGQGKTNFVCDFTENFLVKRGIPSVYYNAADFCETPSVVIKRFLTVNGTYDEKFAFFMLTEIWKKIKIPFVVVIDGLNENTSLPNFENHIKQSINELIQLPFIKIIMTTRNELLEERFGRLTQENLGETFFRMDMSGRREERFGERIFEGYLRYFDVHIVRESLLESTYELLTSDTLLLRFFCEVNRGKRQVYMYDVYKYALFNQYYENKKSEMKSKNIPEGEVLFEQLINTICKYMVDNKVYNNVPRDVLSINEIQLLDILLEADVIFKEDQVVKKGFFDEYTEVLSFTFDEFRDFCITQYLLQKPDAQQSFPVIWDKMCNEQLGVLEGVEKYMFFLARTTVPDILPIIENNGNYQYMYWENVWNLEDKDITERDIQEWKKQFDSKGPYRKRLIRHLLSRRNRRYFMVASIDLLFEIMDNIAEHPGEFDDFINTYFPISKVDKYNHEVYQEDCVLYCDYMVKTLMEGLDEGNVRIDYYDFLKLSIYLYGIMPEAIRKLWEKALMKACDSIIKIADEFLKKEQITVVIKYNLKDILESLLTVTKNEKIQELYSKCHVTTQYQHVNTLLEGIWA